ncbi:MAG: glycosylhydrolase-like jelly roll fold domain-containing protein, partial [Bacteroidales bacterium]
MENWQFAEFEDSGWQQADMKGKAGDDPWGTDFLKNAGSSTTPYRPLSVNLNTPLLEVFDEMPDIVYDVKPKSDNHHGWYRFEAPPGLAEITLPKNEARVWVNGIEIPVNNGLVKLNNPPVGVSTVAIRLNMKLGEYAGAAFENPVKLKLGGGKINEGLWQDFALPTYSGIGVYKQTIHFSEEEANREIVLDLGEVYVAAEVFINGKSAGKRVAKPFKYNITEWVEQGENEIEIRVANTLAPHYSLPLRAINLGPVESGLAGPVLFRLK